METMKPGTRQPLGNKWQSLRDAESPGEYGGLPILADSAEVHTRALDLLQRYTDPDAAVLDVGAGAGAFCKRLLDHGYNAVEAIELRAATFRVNDVPVHPWDLNEPWGDRLAGRFDALAALEIIEHLENPWEFGRQCAAALRPGGIAIISMPNIQSSRSRLQFLLNAEFRFFSEKDYQQIGHITSLTARQIAWVCERAGLDLLEQGHGPHKGMPRPRSLRKALRACFYLLTYPFMTGPKHGEVAIHVFRKRPETADVEGPGPMPKLHTAP